MNPCKCDHAIHAHINIGEMGRECGKEIKVT